MRSETSAKGAPTSHAKKPGLRGIDTLAKDLLTMESAPQDAPPPGRFAWLRSQGLGVICGQATVLLLAIGSITITATRDGASANVQLDTFRPFIDEPSWVHWWFYALAAVMGLYALNTLLATWESVARKWRAGIRTPFAYGAALIHISFLVALVAHLIGGLYSEERGIVVLGVAWQDVGDNTRARLSELTVESYTNHQPRQVQAHVEMQQGDGEIQKSIVGFNAPLSTGWADDIFLLVNWGVTPQVAYLSAGGHSCHLAVGEGCSTGGAHIALNEIGSMGMRGRTTYIPEFTITPDGAPEGQTIQMAPWHTRALPNGETLKLEWVETRPAIVLRHRYAPGNSWALVGAALLLLGVVLLGRRWVQ